MIESPDYPGINAKTREIRQRYPHLSRQQAYVMAAVELRPDRNSQAVFVGWDSKRRPVFERTEYGRKRRHAQTRAGDPTELLGPVYDEVPSS